MNNDRVNIKKQRLADAEKLLLTVCALAAKAEIINEDSAKALEELSSRWRYLNEDLGVTVEMVKKNERRKE